MHELAIAESIVAAVRERLGDTPVRRLRLEIGQLSGVVPDALRFCFQLATTGTGLEDAELEIHCPPGSGRCRDCGTEFTTSELIAMCRCGSVDVEVTGGRELMIKNVEVAQSV
ncbi:MAG TPA: hydrogenase maturation nickel metallochaperone HypA [Pseudonocardia sp.]|jgi:hydrogenase nickel incorporation protein HypA/HybF|nr:hydrogenase maturation nickel metallochaperone HypA [Pseudonocardia sp.]